jgi:hypothetical protein
MTQSTKIIFDINLITQIYDTSITHISYDYCGHSSENSEILFPHALGDQIRHPPVKV